MKLRDVPTESTQRNDYFVLIISYASCNFFCFILIERLYEMK